MTKEEYNLLENVLTGLDRLYDCQSNAIDLHALIFATSRALVDTEYFSILHDTSIELEAVLKSMSEVRDERREALGVTDNLRLFIAEKLETFFRQEVSI
jgi:hypothetical protein